MVAIGTWNLENLYRPGGAFGPDDEPSYRAKLEGIAKAVNELDVDVLGVQEIGDPEALDDLADLLEGTWQVAVSSLPDSRGIRVGFLSNRPLEVRADVADLPDELAPLQADDSGTLTTRMGRGALVVDVEPTDSPAFTVVTCHLKSKLLTYPGGRF